MSKVDSELPERLGSAGATGLEQRLLRAATNERPSRELSERMARGIGLALPAIGAGGAASLSAKSAAAKSAISSSSLLPWLTGGLAAALVVGGLVALGSKAAPDRAPAPSAPTSTALKAAPVLPGAPLRPAAGAPAAGASPRTADDAAAKPLGSLVPQRNRAAATAATAATANELAKQVALVDGARAALASGRAEQALGIVREYQATYPRGTFRPEAAAIKIEALLKLGRKAEARASAEGFAAAYGPGPLADRVTRLAGIAQP
jgi:hypothetical protein